MFDLNLGDRISDLIVLDPEAGLIEESRLLTSQASLQRKFSNLPPSRAALRSVPTLDGPAIC